VVVVQKLLCVIRLKMEIIIPKWSFAHVLLLMPKGKMTFLYYALLFKVFRNEKSKLGNALKKALAYES